MKGYSLSGEAFLCHDLDDTIRASEFASIIKI